VPRKLFAILLIAVLGITAIHLYRYSSPTVVFTVPNGFSGLVLIEGDWINGVRLQRKDGEYLVEVPESGKLTVKSLKPLMAWHKERAHFKDGRKLPTEGLYDDNEIGLFPITYVAGKGVFYFVGSRRDYNKICGITGVEKLPLATTNITAH
jgi:hypothetical protein